jgi:hypothetical protein
MHFGDPVIRERIMRGEITETVRVWLRPRAKVGGCYALGPGCIEVTSVTEVDEARITDALSRRLGFRTADEMMKIARHGAGDRIFLVRFVYRDERPLPAAKAKKKPRRKIKL